MQKYNPKSYLTKCEASLVSQEGSHKCCQNLIKQGVKLFSLLDSQAN